MKWLVLIMALILYVGAQYDLNTGRLTLALTNAAITMGNTWMDCVGKNGSNCNDTDLSWWEGKPSFIYPPLLQFGPNMNLEGVVWARDVTLELLLSSHTFTEPYAIVTRWEQNIYLAFHGTQSPIDGTIDETTFMVPFAPISPSFSKGKVHKGWYELYNAIRGNIQEILNPFANGKYSLFISGHSLGASLSNLAMADIATNGSNWFKLTLYNSASPKIGDQIFAQEWNTYVGSSHTCYSLINTADPVPNLPPGAKYSHVGTLQTFTTNRGNIDSCVNHAPDPVKCVVNHDPRCVYLYTLNQAIDIQHSIPCKDCNNTPKCLLCVPPNSPPYTPCLINPTDQTNLEKEDL